jgi:translation initiation factor IF-2
MSKRLVKIAKELNVGTSTIVDHLIKSGFEIENKPTAKVTDEMHNELLKAFSNSIAEKEKADQLIIGTRPQVKPAEIEVTVPVIEIPKEEPIVEEVKEVEVVEVVEEVVKPVEKVEVKEEQKPKLKVIGKIDLDKPKAKKVKDTKKEEVVETVPKVEEVKQKEEEIKPDSDEKVVEELMRAETPQLQGLKILGKIDKDKLQEKAKKKKKVKEEVPAKKSGEAAPKSRPQDASNRRRKRTRKKITASTISKDQGRGRGKKAHEEVKQVSQKEIEDKIKATMARLSGSGKNKRQKIRRDSREDKREKQELKDTENVSKAIELTEFISVSELGGLMDVPITDIITTCMNLGVIVSINQRLDAEIIELLAEEFGHEVTFISAEETIDDEEDIIDDPADLQPRAPIVTVMGHVDHGKTSLLDYIRSANVVSGEAGGITQHIGAYEVVVGEAKKKITFLDTPGHEAFTAMRARGAKVTDVAVIIIAADDNIMPQTKEAISHAQAAGVPMVFAINKIDKPGADPERIKQELASLNFLVEDWGGQYQSSDISAKQGTNIDSLLEKILLEAEVLELKANPSRNSVGTVLEASLDKGRGYVTKLLVQNGTLDIGDPIVAGEHSGKIKAMFNERGKRVKAAGPSTPVLILGLSGAPQAGEKFKEFDSEQEARQLATKRSQINREQTTRASKRISLDEIGRRLALGTFKELNLIVKGDVDGSIEALADSLIKLSIETVQVNVIHKAVGQIVESDVLLASASDAIVIGFQVRPSSGARNLAEKEGVQIKSYSIIYEAIEEIKMAIEGMLEPTKEEKIVAQVEVRETYKISKIGTIAGCYVQEGKISRNTNIRIVRDGIVIYPNKEGVKGEISSLKRFKDDIKEVKSGLECGITIKNYNDIKVGDIIEGYEIIEIKQKLDS